MLLSALFCPMNLCMGHGVSGLLFVRLLILLTPCLSSKNMQAYALNLASLPSHEGVRVACFVGAFALLSYFLFGGVGTTVYDSSGLGLCTCPSRRSLSPPLCFHAAPSQHVALRLVWSVATLSSMLHVGSFTFLVAFSHIFLAINLSYLSITLSLSDHASRHHTRRGSQGYY